MPDASLKVVIGADVQNALVGIKSVETASVGLGRAVKDTEERFNIQNTALNKSSGYMRQQEQAAKALADAEKNVGASSLLAASGIEKIGGSSRGILEPLNNAYNVIRKVAYALPGIGISGIFLAGFEAIASAFGKEEKAVDDASKAVEAHQKLVEGVISKTKEESTTVDILVGKIQSGTLSRQETVQAIKELQKIAPDYFSKLNAEKASIEDVTKAYGLYNQQIVKTIEAQIRIAEIAEIVKRRLTQTSQTPEAAKFIADLQAQGKTLEEINAIVVKGTGEDIKAQAELLRGNKYVSDEKLKQGLLDAKVPAGVQTILNLLQQEQKILKDINDVSKLVDLGKPPKIKIEPVIDQDPQKTPIRLGTFLDTSNFDPQIKTIEKRFREKPMLLSFTFDKAALDAAYELGKEIGRIISAGIPKGFADIGASIGEAIASGKDPIAAAGKSILNTVGDLIEQIGKALIEYGIVKTGLDKIIEGGIAIPGVAAIAVGVAAVALGALVKGLAQPRRAFAEGGIVTGPTNALIGEAGPEVVFPLDKLNRFMRGNANNSPQMNLAGQFVVKGTDLVLAVNRQNKLNNNAS
jgi:hypothetical protein